MLTVRGMLISSTPVFPSKMRSPNSVTFGGSTILLSTDPANAELFIEVTVSGSTILFTLLFPSNAPFPIATTVCPSISSGTVRAATFPLYPAIVAFPSPSTVYV